MPRQCTEQQKVTVLTDHQLVERIRESDEVAFNVLYERFFQRVYAFSFCRLRNHADTEEVVQETFMAVMRSIGAYRGESSLVSWIYGIARNTVNSHLRRSKAHEVRLEQARSEFRQSSSSVAFCTPEDQLNLQRCADAIQDRLASVSDWQAKIFVLRHLENLPIGEIGKRMSRSNDAVRSSLYRVKRQLLEVLDPNLAAPTPMAHRAKVKSGAGMNVNVNEMGERSEQRGGES